VQRLEHWLTRCADGDTTRLVFSLRHGAQALSALPGPWKRVLTLSGPEGGLTAAEEDLACADGFIATQLGERVLRAETAPLAALAYLGLK
jgi:16S rRNA (uracil1498-N3)-methyltransferase